ncbi:hypothetical protein [Halobaculum sp. MBLA0143]|uniref:DUF7522 family protein n=1 Tax=Halobaculum sp. MBLA0143 TaxID=3079933 RepID=UPI003524C1EF
MSGVKDDLVSALRDAGGDGLRDAWLFDETGHESLYLRPDVRDRVTDLNVEQYIDNERYGYVTRNTWESLHYTDYEFTIRGFGEFLLYRTFLGDGDRPVGLMASFDPEVAVSFPELTRTLYDCVADESVTVDGE